MFSTELLLSISPILLLGILLLVFKKPLVVSAPITLAFTILIAVFAWQINSDYILPSFLKGLLITIDICLILFGAIFFIDILKDTGILNSLEHYLTSLSKDRRIQVLIIIWFFGSFIEGSSGFGTQGVIIAPLLVAIGFPASLAILLVLINTSIIITFGAVGTPIRIGFSGLDTTGVPFYTGLISLIVGFIIPLTLIFFTVSYNKKNKLKSFIEFLPFTIYAAACLLIPFFITTLTIPDFASIIAPIVGLPLIILAVKKKFLVPKTEWKFDHDKPKKISGKLNWKKTIIPYAILILLLILGRFAIPSTTITLQQGVTHSIPWLSTGLAFIITALITILINKTKKEEVKTAGKEAFKTLFKPFIAVLTISMFIQVMINTSHNQMLKPGMIEEIGLILNTQALPLIAPFLGALGAFTTGSATVSNLLFGHLEVISATSLGLSIPLILSLQLVGAALGNMISLTNIITIQTSLKTHGTEASIIKKLIMPCTITLIVAAIMGLIITYA